MPAKSLRRLAVLTVASVMAGSTAHATTASIVRSGPDGWILIDRTSIDATGAGGVRTASTVTVQPRLVGGLPGYVRTVNAYDCVTRRVRWQTFSVYSRLGVKVLTKDNDRVSDWTTVAPRSDEDIALRLVCYGGGEAVVTADSMGRIVLGIIQSWDQLPLTPPAAGPPIVKPPILEPSAARRRPAK